MKRMIISVFVAFVFYTANAQTTTQTAIKLTGTDQVGFALPLQVDDNPTGLTFGSNTWGRQIRLSRLGNTYHYDIGLDNSNEFYIMKRNSFDIAFKIAYTGNVGIGTTNPGNFKLAVEGKVGAREVKVTLDSWADYVFHKDYNLMSLASLEAFIQKNKHLPNIPSAKEVKENEGIDLGDMNKKLLEKIEELTLHMIEMNKRMGHLEKENESLKKTVAQLLPSTQKNF